MLVDFSDIERCHCCGDCARGEKQSKRDDRAFSSVSIGTSVFILALTGILTPCLIEEYGLILGLLFILFILVWSCILANASRIYSEEERIKTLGKKSRRKNLNQRRKFSKIKLEKLPGEANKTKYLKWHRYGPPVLLVFYSYIPAQLCAFHRSSR